MIWLLLILVGVGAVLLVSRSVRSIEESAITRLAEAIARAEGYYVAGSLPRRMNNPGSLTDITGKLRQYETPEQGWEALRDQVRRMLSGTSLIYRPSMDIRRIADIYTGGDNPESWARTVAQHLGISTSTRLSELV